MAWSSIVMFYTVTSPDCDDFGGGNGGCDDSRTFPVHVVSEIDRPYDATNNVGRMFVVDDDTCWVMVVVMAIVSSRQYCCCYCHLGATSLLLLLSSWSCDDS